MPTYVHLLSDVNYYLRMAKKIDPDDLVDATAVADLLGFASRNVVSVYRKRHSDFPAPVVDMGAGRCLLWLRSDVEAWARARQPRQ